jgi:hypothetical protein
MSLMEIEQSLFTIISLMIPTLTRFVGSLRTLIQLRKPSAGYWGLDHGVGNDDEGMVPCVSFGARI